MQRKIYIENMPLEEALHLFMQRLEAVDYFNVEEEYVDVLLSPNRITSSAVLARRSSPHYMASAMDGIAVKASSTFAASEFNPVDLKKDRDFVEVDTGDYIPTGYDAVIMIEDVNFIGNAARIIKPAVPWQHIRSVGEDLVAQDMIIPTASKIGPFEVASLLTAAVEQVPVARQPRIAIIPTGTELRDRGSETMAPGEIVESNSRMLAGLCTQWGAIACRHQIVIDDREKLVEAVKEVKDQADMIVICSGSSAGREDYTSSIVEQLGELLVHGIATRPGKPAILGLIDNKPVIGVPGYPVSAQLIFHLFAQPVILRKQGLPLPQMDTLKTSIARKVASHMGVDEFVYVNVARLKDGYVSFPLSRGAGITTSLVKADGYIHISRGLEGLQAGDTCIAHLNRPNWLIDATLVAIGSHDMAIDIIADIMQKKYHKRLISSHVGSMGGIMALKREETHFSGIHLLDYETGDYNISYLKKYLPDKKFLLINLVNRQQGLIIKKQNPLQIEGLKDLSRQDVRYINRQRGAGTRILFDYLLNRNGIDPSSINGYNREEYTHLAVAAAVKNDACDTGMGVYASAKVMDLDFLPLTEERYDLCIMPELMDDSSLNMLMDIIQSDQFKKQINHFGGYNTDNTGKILYSSNI